MQINKLRILITNEGLADNRHQDGFWNVVFSNITAIISYSLWLLYVKNLGISKLNLALYISSEIVIVQV